MFGAMNEIVLFMSKSISNHAISLTCQNMHFAKADAQFAFHIVSVKLADGTQFRETIYNTNRMLETIFRLPPAVTMVLLSK